MIIFRASHGHWHTWVYSTRMSWVLKHPPNPNWEEWTLLLANLTSACSRVKLVTSVIDSCFIAFYSSFDFSHNSFYCLLFLLLLQTLRTVVQILFPFYITRRIIYWDPKHLYFANALKAKMSLRVQAEENYQGLFCLMEPVFIMMVWDICPGWWVSLKKLTTLSLRNWA